MKKTFIFFLLISFYSLMLQAQINNKGNRNQTYPIVTEPNAETMQWMNEVDTVNFFNSISWMQQYIRDARFQEALITQNWLIDQFEALGLETAIHYFPFSWDMNEPGDTLEAGNVIAIQPGTEFPDEYVVVCSHYDHPDGPGADDNASGTAGVLEIARILSQHSFKRTILYISFNCEEYMVQGSMHFAQECAKNDMNILGVFNLDMISFFPSDIEDLTLHAGYAIINKKLFEFYETVANIYVPEIPTSRFSNGDAWGGDHERFIQMEYPSIYIGDIEYLSVHPCYHKPCDTIGNGCNNFRLMEGFVQTTLAAMVELSNGWLPPQNFSSIPTDSKITLRWDASPETSSYKIYKDNLFLVETTATEYEDLEVENGTLYRYFVKGVHAVSGIESAESNHDSIKPSLPLSLPHFNDFETDFNDFFVNNDQWNLASVYGTPSGTLALSNDTVNDIQADYQYIAETNYFSIPEDVTNVFLHFHERLIMHPNMAGSYTVFVEATTDRQEWNILETFSAPASWKQHEISLHDYIGEPYVQIRFRMEAVCAYIGTIRLRLYLDNFAINFSGVSIPEHQPESDHLTTVEITPNPTTGLVNVNTNLTNSYAVAVYNIQGIKVLQKESFTNGVLDVSMLPKGAYLVSIQTPSHVITKKMIVQ